MTTSRRLTDHVSVLFLVVTTVCLAGYMLLRFNGMFADQDTAVYTQVAAAIEQTGSLTTQPTYPNGFGYSAFVALLSMFTGISVSNLQLYGMPFLLVLPILGGYVAFREMLDERRGLFAALLLLLHPALLFTAFRSTHEKFTYFLVLVSLYCLYVTFAERYGPLKSRFVLVGYLTILGVTFLNVYFASSFIAAVAFSLGATVVLSRYYGQPFELRRLGYTLGVSFAFLMVVVLFLYPPARGFLTNLGTVSTQTLYLLLGNAPRAIPGSPSPYSSVFTRWDSFRLYLLLVSFYLVAYPIAGLQWLAAVREYLSEQSIDREQLPHVFVLLLAAAFGTQLVAAIVADQTGLLGANMQLRIFPLFGFLVIVLATSAVYHFLGPRETPTDDGGTEDCSRLARIWNEYQQVIPVLLVVLLVMFSVTSMVKATSDPTVSTGWTVTTEREQAAMAWSDTELKDEYLWSGYTTRLRNGHLIRHPGNGLRNRYDLNEIDLVVQYLIVSDITKKHAEVGGFPLPPRDDANRIYANGETRLYWFGQYRTFDEYNEAFRRSQR